ncbi:MAG: segregation/condensation protein A [Treponema sp.]|jgi:segregation and condensation protein A|nr:segregation/condensation protein A [Treponema sp.]
METVVDSSGRNFKVNQFIDPLDTLLAKIKKNEINICDISIADITDQYLEYLAVLETLDLDELSVFHSMATELIFIKSRMLLPVEIDLGEEYEDPRQELVEKLIEYQKFKKLSELMEEKEREAEWAIERKCLERYLPFADDELWVEADVKALQKIFSDLLSIYSGEGLEQIVNLYEEVTINEKTVLMMEILEEKGECRFTDLIIRHDSILDKICAFLALLEAVKVRMVVVLQHRMFGDILIKPLRS